MTSVLSDNENDDGNKEKNSEMCHRAHVSLGYTTNSSQFGSPVKVKQVEQRFVTRADISFIQSKSNAVELNFLTPTKTNFYPAVKR